MSNGGGRVTIPASVRKMIQNIKEISGGHGDEEIYFMLKECNMDPNETAQKLLLQGQFHEVKKKRDRRKENVKESAESRWRPGMQSQGNRGGRGNYSSRYTTHDAGGVGRNFVSLKENGTRQVPADKVAITTLSASQDVKNKEASHVSSLTVMIDGHAGISSESKSVGHTGQPVTAATPITKLDDPIPSKSTAEANKTNTKDTHVQPMPSSSNASTSKTSTPSSGVCISASDPVSVPSQDLWLVGAVGTIKHDVGMQQSSHQLIPVIPADNKSNSVSSEVESSLSFMQETMPNISLAVHKDQLSESSQAAASTHSFPTVSRPLSDDGVQSPQIVEPQKVVGPNKEWKPKSSNPNLSEGSGTTLMSEVPAIPVEARSQDAKQTTFKLEKKLEESRISDSRHVIIPDHIHVPEVEKLGFIFGSFDANFGPSTSYSVCPENEKSPPISETSEGIEKNADQTSNQNESVSLKEEDCHPSSPNAPESLISDVRDVSSRVLPEYTESKQETDMPPGSQQYISVHTYPNYSFGIMPSMVGSQVPPTESTESQTHDVSRLPSFVVHQPFDPTGYYAPFYRSGADSDGRVSPFHAPAISTKFNGNVTMLPPQASQSSQEAGNNLILPTAGPTPLVSQAAGAVPSSIAVTQQTLPVFRQPAGMHMPHYPNYIPYGHYFPFYVPPPAMHQFLSNGAFAPPQPQAGSVYPASPASTNKYSLPQYKPGNNTGNSNHVGAPVSYGPYGSTPASFSPISATTTIHSSSSDDLLTTQLKENNLYIAGQQSEGPGIWFAAPGRDISGLQASSFYSLPQAQMAFPPTQVGHGSFAGIYHPAQPVAGAAVHPLLPQSQTAGAIDMNGPATSVYQPSQPAPINWPNNY